MHSDNEVELAEMEATEEDIYAAFKEHYDETGEKLDSSDPEIKVNSLLKAYQRHLRAALAELAALRGSASIPYIPTPATEEDLAKSKEARAILDAAGYRRHEHALVGFEEWWKGRDHEHTAQAAWTAAYTTGNHAGELKGMEKALEAVKGERSLSHDQIMAAEEEGEPWGDDRLTGRALAVVECESAIVRLIEAHGQEEVKP